MGQAEKLYTLLTWKHFTLKATYETVLDMHDEHCFPLACINVTSHLLFFYSSNLFLAKSFRFPGKPKHGPGQKPGLFTCPVG